MTDTTFKYIILEDTYYLALDLSDTIKRLRPCYRLAGIAEETAEAIRMIISEEPDLMIADTSAGDGDSINVLKSKAADIPVIFISEYAMLEKRARSLNMIDFILKPVTSPDLERALNRFDEMKQTRDDSLADLIPEPNHL